MACNSNPILSSAPTISPVSSPGSTQTASRVSSQASTRVCCWNGVTVICSMIKDCETSAEALKYEPKERVNFWPQYNFRPQYKQSSPPAATGRFRDAFERAFGKSG